MKSNKSFFFVKLHFLAVLNFFPAIFEIAKNWIWSKKIFVKLIYLIPQVFLAWTFKNFLWLIQIEQIVMKNTIFPFNIWCLFIIYLVVEIVPFAKKRLLLVLAKKCTRVATVEWYAIKNVLTKRKIFVLNPLFNLWNCKFSWMNESII